MIVCISGLSGSGKNTAGDLLAKKLGLRHVQFTFKDEAAARGISLMELQKLANENPSLDKEFDERLVHEAQKGNCVVTTWLGPWMIKNADVRIWLYADNKTRAKRISSRDKMSFDEAYTHSAARDADNVRRYKKYYGIDINDMGVFDIQINSGKFDPEEIVALITQVIRAREPALREVK